MVGLFEMTSPGTQCVKSFMLLSFLTHVTVYFGLSRAAPSPLFCFECPSLDLLGCMKDALGLIPASNTPNLQEKLTSERICVLVCWRVVRSSAISPRSKAISELRVSPCGTENAVNPTIFLSKGLSDPYGDLSDGNVEASRSPRPITSTSHTGSGTEEPELGVTPSDPYSEEESPHQAPDRRPRRSGKGNEPDLRNVGCQSPWWSVLSSSITELCTLLAAKMMGDATIWAATRRNAE